MNEDLTRRINLLRLPATWKDVLDTIETQWIAATLASFVTVQDDGGVLFPRHIQFELSVTSIILTGGARQPVQFMQPQILEGIHVMNIEGLIAFDQKTAEITLLTGYRDLVTAFIR